MSLSPTAKSDASRHDYQLGWEAIHRMLREGLSWSGRETHCAFLNLRDGTFTTVSGQSGLDFPDDGRAAAALDWDGDGAADLVMSSRQAPRLRLMRHRNLGAARWLALRPLGTRCNRDGIGARIEVRLADGARLVDGVRAGEGFLAQSSKWVFFGLGRDGEVAGVRVRWPGSSEWEEFGGVGAPGRYELPEGQGRARSDERAPQRVRLAEAAVVAPRSSERARIPLAARLPLPPLAWRSADGSAVALHEPGSPRLVLLWANWCAPCGSELQALSAARERLDSSGLDLLALDADPQQTGDLLERVGWPWGRGSAEAELLDALDVVQRSVLDRQRPLPLPSAFLLDARGAVAVIYKGALDVDALLADAARLEGTPQSLRAAAVPFAGRWLESPPAPDFPRAARFAAERGLEQVQRFYQLAQIEIRRSSPAVVAVSMGAAQARAGKLNEAVELFRQAAEAEPDLVEAWRHLGAALHEIGLIEEAIGAYLRALQLDGAHAPTLHNLALARLASGDEPGARSELERLRSFDAAAATELEGALERSRAAPARPLER